MSIADSIQERERIAALDFTKGVLVLFMVLYHWLNYFVSPTGLFYNYLRFITPAFVFITGFLITNLALSKYAHSSRALRNRLAERGLKLLGLFTLLNLGTGALASGQDHGVGAARDIFTFFHNAGNVYLFGDGKTAAFQILVPISYVLIIASLLTFSGPRFKAFALGSAGVGALWIGILTFMNRPTGYLYCLGSGVLGLCIGALPLRTIERSFRFPTLLIGSYCLYLTAVTLFDVSYSMQLAGSLLSLLLIYWLAKTWESDKAPYGLVVILGKYSLFAYIAQIAILQVIRAVLRHVLPGGLCLAVSFAAAFAFTISAVLLADMARSKDKVADRIYRLVFA